MSNVRFGCGNLPRVAFRRLVATGTQRVRPRKCKWHKISHLKNQWRALPSLVDLVQALPLAALLTDHSGVVLSCTTACSELLGSLGSGGEVNLTALICQTPGSGTLVVSHRQIRWTALRIGSARPGSESQLLWTFEDVTGIRALELAHDHAQGELRLLSAHMRGIVFELNSEARFVRVWTSDPQLLAMPEQELLGRTLLETLGQLSAEFTRPLWENRARLTMECETVPSVLAHQGCLVQVFTNLIANAAEAIAPNAPQDNEIAISVRPQPPNQVQIEVRDSGVGIAPKDSQRVFEPFFTTKEHGTGLGLPLCQMIVSAFNGEIQLEPGLAQGCTFRVLLPAAVD